ncbi:hypothetical protein FBD94_14945 [Pedobacter hiemivivus]|uniref:PKD-like family protein n=1 Tax=Pedobacter hiemivivus TaxID=2530454 RepID=A0A4V5PCG0_9SPHI|nr:PKD-like family lipoprotein [Pedobacter hiemivivus]TKC60206.1 hypothetical protein FBD94_14945 [Pedobacter hiemivivus]
MKAITKKICLFLFIAISFLACKKDLSSLDNNKIDGVVVDATGTDVLNVFQFDHLVVKPKITTSLKETDLTYEWRINIIPSDTTSLILGTTKDLDAEIRLKPNNSLDYHQLKYIITDKSTGLKYITVWKVNVRNSIGEGLVIAETSADGISSDISHIMSPLVTPDYASESIKRHVYSAINGKTIPGLIKEMLYTNVANANSIIATTPTSITTIRTLDYTFSAANDDLFFGHVGTYKPEAIYKVKQSEVYVENGKMAGSYLSITKKFGLPFDFKYQVPGQLAINAYSDDVKVAANFYDEKNGYFVYMPSVSTYGDRTMYPYPSISGGAFNPGNLPNKLNIAAGVGVGEDILHVLKDKTTGKLELYVLDKGGFNSDDWVTIPPTPKAFYDMSNAPGINEATKFVLLDNQKVLYYATANKIYAMLYGDATPTFQERYTLTAGETIGTLQIYRQSDYPYGELYLPTNNKQLIMSTYNGTEGKLYIMPMINIGIGNIDLPNIKSYGGFGKITAITTQK